MRRVKIAAIGLAMIAALGMGRAVRAETVTADLVGLIPFAGGDLSLNGSTLSGDGVGELVWNGAGFGNASPFNGSFDTFCIDLNEIINFNNVYSFNLVSLTSVPKPTSGAAYLTVTKALEIEDLYGEHLGSLGSILGNGDYQAFQLALWNIVYDTDASVSNGAGTFYVPSTSTLDPSVITEANSWLTEALSLPLGDLYATDLVGMQGLEIDASGDFAQDQVVIVPGSDIPIGGTTPLPSAALMGAVLLAGYGLVRSVRGGLRTEII